MPLRLEIFLQFSFSNKVFMFLLYYTGSVLRSRNSRKAFKFLSKRLVLLLYGNQYRHLCLVHKTTYLWSMRSPGGGELSRSACPGVGNRPPSENKIANPRGCARGGMVTGRIEPCITAPNAEFSLLTMCVVSEGKIVYDVISGALTITTRLPNYSLIKIVTDRFRKVCQSVY